MPKKKAANDPGIPEWVLTYGDLMSLLLCFFILLAAFSELKQPREYIKVIESIKEAMGFRGGMGIQSNNQQQIAQMLKKLDQQSKQEHESQARDESNSESLSGENPQTSVVHEGQRFAQGGSILFEPGVSELSERAQEQLRTEVAPLIRGQRYVCVIVGHAWGFADKAGASPDDLSYQRARNVKEFLVRECAIDEVILRVEAAGVHEPQSISPGSVDQGGENRRVQVWMTGRTVDQTHPDPDLTGRAGP